jgi:hypothetical protein
MSHLGSLDLKLVCTMSKPGVVWLRFSFGWVKKRPGAEVLSLCSALSGACMPLLPPEERARGEADSLTGMTDKKSKGKGYNKSRSFAALRMTSVDF